MSMKNTNLQTNCPNCGAPIDSIKCPYCGTVFINTANVSLSDPFFLQFVNNGRVIRTRVILQNIDYELSSDSPWSVTANMSIVGKTVEVHT